jgi:hypothetical protein
VETGGVAVAVAEVLSVGVPLGLGDAVEAGVVDDDGCSSGRW